MLPLCRARNITESLARYRVNPRGLTQQTRRMRAAAPTGPRGAMGALGLTYDLHDDALSRD